MVERLEVALNVLAINHCESLGRPGFELGNGERHVVNGGGDGHCEWRFPVEEPPVPADYPGGAPAYWPGEKRAAQFRPSVAEHAIRTNYGDRQDEAQQTLHL